MTITDLTKVVYMLIALVAISSIKTAVFCVKVPSITKSITKGRRKSTIVFIITLTCQYFAVRKFCIVLFTISSVIVALLCIENATMAYSVSMQLAIKVIWT